jgi:MFS family permease
LAKILYGQLYFLNVIICTRELELLKWLSRDGKLLLATRPLSSFSTSFVSIFLAVYLNLIGLPLWQIGLILTGGLLASTFFNVVAGFLADRVGRKKMLVVFSLMIAFSGIVFAFVDNHVILFLVAVISTMGYRGGFGPTAMLERVILAQSCSDEWRTQMYAIRSTLNSATRSIGSLFVGTVVLLQNWYGLTEINSYRILFFVYALLNLVITIIYSQLSSAAEIEEFQVEQPLSLSPETRTNVLKLSLLFSIDSFGSGFITSSLVSYWFFNRFGLNMDAIGIIFSASSLFAAVSFLFAARISKRIGLINTMVFSHLPANMMTMTIPYMPTLTTLIILYFSRALLSQMDVPTRQSYIMAIVKPEERSKVAGLINLPRSLTSAISPSIAAFIMQFVGLSIPFLIAGGLKSAYDIILYLMFRHIKPPEEM